jgi:hypothetical protein
VEEAGWTGRPVEKEAHQKQNIGSLRFHVGHSVLVVISRSRVTPLSFELTVQGAASEAKCMAEKQASPK